MVVKISSDKQLPYVKRVQIAPIAEVAARISIVNVAATLEAVPLLHYSFAVRRRRLLRALRNKWLLIIDL